MKKSLIVAAALWSIAAAVQAEELFVNIHSGSAMAQGAGLVLAGQALEQRATVRVLLCDAPTGALDVRTGIVVLEALESINRELGTLAAIITHNAVMAAMADRVFSLSDGRVVNVQTNAQRAPVSTLAW
jgi:ABC-type cobalamin/Fe3+-siderophores transport system ATPase subunit